MKNLLFLFLLFVTHFTFSQDLSRENAIQKALYEFIVPATLDHSVTAYITERPLKRGDIITPFVDGTDKRVERPTWFVWINDTPEAYFAHPTRYLFIDANSGDVELSYEDWWPELNGESIFMTEQDRNNLDLIFYSDLHRKIPDN